MVMILIKQLVSRRRRVLSSSGNVGLNIDDQMLIISPAAGQAHEQLLVKLMSSCYHFLNIIMLIMFMMMMMISIQPSSSASQPTTSTTNRLPQYEVTALEQIGKSLGKGWNFSVNPCSGDSGWITPPPLDPGYENKVTCNCPQNGTLCHVQSIVLKGQGLAGNLPRQLTRLSSLQFLDLSRNYLNGTIPEEWGSMRLLNLSLMSNRLSGPIPKKLGNIITLQDLSLEGNMFSGQVPPELGNLTSLIRLLLSSNNFTGELPATFRKLTNMKDFRISDNAFTGKIPDYITSWTTLEKLSIQGTLMEGPFPEGINSLTNLTRIMVSDLGGTFLEFPQLSGLKKLRRLTIRNSRLSGQIPESIGELTNLQILDLSFNNLTGVVPSSLRSLKGLDDLFLTSNNLTGLTPEWILRANMDLDLSYNNFTGIISGTTPDCTQGNVNLVESISKNLKNQNSISTCLRKDFPCASKKPQYSSLHINCGSKEAASNGTTIYEADGETRGAATLFISNKGNWAFSSTGIFIDNDQPGYIATNSSILNMSNPKLYKTARLTPLSLKYYGLCLWNGAYTVKLHFAEIVITDDKNFTSLGRRIFDIYIQGVLVQKDFNIKEAAIGSNKAFILAFPANVSANTLEIHLFWAGKGTTAIPKRGVYGPLISALSVEANFTPPEDDEVIEKRKIIMGVTIGLASFIFLTLLILAILWKKGCLCKPEKELRGLDLQTGSFSLRQIKSATKNFDSSNKIGEGGFGPVYKGHLSDGTTIAVKQLSSKSRQGNREFVNEIGMISALQHPNLVKLYGCCIEGHQLHLVYEYMENNCLARALFGRESQRLKLDWPTRCKICIGIARGLAYLHEESPLKIVHRDIKSTNILLDKDLNAKISDFGLAKLEEEGHTHISTRIAGTIGYMAPEYAMRGHLTYRADIYSFGIVALEIISGKSNTNSNHEDECFFLLDWACVLQDRGDLLDMVDPELGTNYSKEEVLTVVNIALLCTNSSPSLRPTMSTVVSMLEGKTTVHPQPQSPELSSAELNDRIRFILHQQSKRRTDKDSADGPWTGSSESAIGNSERTELSELLRNSSKDISLA